MTASLSQKSPLPSVGEGWGERSMAPMPSPSPQSSSVKGEETLGYTVAIPIL